MSVLPITTAFERIAPDRQQEKVSAISENSENTVSDSGSFAKTLKALGQVDQQGKFEKVKSEHNALGSQEVIPDIGEHEDEKREGDSDKRARVSESGDQSKAEGNEQRNIEVDLSMEMAGGSGIHFFQMISGKIEHPETQELGLAQIPEEDLSEGPEVDLKENHRLMSELHIEKGPERQGLTRGFPEVKGEGDKTEALNVDAFQIGQNEPGETTVTKESVVETAEVDLEGKTGALETEKLNPSATLISHNGSGKNTSDAKTNKGGDALFVKSPTGIGLDEMSQESLSGDTQAGEFQEGKGGGEGKGESEGSGESGGTQSRTQFTDDFQKDDFQKISSFAQPLSPEAARSEPERAQTTLGFSEKMAILSQITGQIRVLQPGKVEHLRLSLHPESLGALQVEITLHEGGVVARIITGDHLVKDLLEENQALLHQSLSEQGFEVDGFSVDVRETPHGFKDREMAHPFFEERQLNPKSDGGLPEEVSPELNTSETGRISLYV